MLAKSTKAYFDQRLNYWGCYTPTPPYSDVPDPGLQYTI
jgi:hypothetical protein